MPKQTAGVRRIPANIKGTLRGGGMQTFVRPTVGNGAMTLASSWYTSPEIFAAEQERIVAREWICVGREEQIARTGGFLYRRDRRREFDRHARRLRHGACIFQRLPPSRDPSLRAGAGRFHGSIQCPYHAWTYGLERRAQGSAQHGRRSRLRSRGLSAQRSGCRLVGRLHLRSSHRVAGDF